MPSDTQQKFRLGPVRGQTSDWGPRAPVPRLKPLLTLPMMSMAGCDRSVAYSQSTTATCLDVSQHISETTRSVCSTLTTGISAHHHHQQQQQQQSTLSRKLLLPPAANDKKQSKINWVISVGTDSLIELFKYEFPSSAILG